ncbi:MAG: hypothetical protein Q4B09_09520, partial [Lachnospiraceae bacterium]|nr:hypothetical protein [Lachnospiraceae bacterium]
MAFFRLFPVKYYIVLSTFLLLVFAFRYQPSTLSDIYRYRESFVYMKTYGITAAYDRLWYVYEGSMLFYYLMVGMSYLPFVLFVPVCIAVTYGVAMWIFFDAVKQAKLTKDEFSILFIFFICCVNFGMIFSILRFYLAYIWGFAGIYIWFQKERKTFYRILAAALMASSIFLHSSGFMIPVIWLLIEFYHFRAVRAASLLIPLTLFFINPLISVLNRFLGGISLYHLIVNKYYSYAGKSYAESVFTRTN